MKQPKKERGYRIERLDQIRALITPARQEILDALEIIGPAPVSTIATLLGRPADSLYHHIRLLSNVGLVKRVRTRSRGRTREALYDLSRRPMQIDYDLHDRRKRDALNALVRGMSRLAVRDFQKATQKGNSVTEGPRRNLRAARMKGYLSIRQIEELNRLFLRIDKIMATRPKDGESATLSAVVFVMTPLEGKSRDRSTARGQPSVPRPYVSRRST